MIVVLTALMDCVNGNTPMKYANDNSLDTDIRLQRARGISQSPDDRVRRVDIR